MNATELKIARIRRRMGQKELASFIGKGENAYSKKESGNVTISLPEVVKLTNALNLTFSEFVLIFLDNELPIRKIVPDDTKQIDFKCVFEPLRVARERMSLSRADVARELGLNLSLYKNRERGVTQVTLAESTVLAKLFDLTFREYNDLFFKGGLPYTQQDVEFTQLP